MKKRYALPVMMALAVPAISTPMAATAETGYIRIGDECFIPYGNGGLIRIPCPREVSENP